MAHFILYSRSYCHLCEDMLQALKKYSDEYAFTVDVIDVDSDESLVAQYDELVPVLVVNQEGRTVELCRYFLDDAKISAFLAAA